eukprot:TRINITY_DN47761_c0_g1_i1.p1 TRINITY_DN47761_c0_g1~~TRINITY_DN47761_c0_g1_i1.p1  ORF type:complete len:265 (+),score=56.46 TRINITY_DN47761_c0_g1_i1:65-796(+)
MATQSPTAAAFTKLGSRKPPERTLRVDCRERINLCYTFRWVKVFYISCMALTVFLIVWTATTDDIDHVWITALEAILTLLFTAEVSIRVYAHPAAPCCRSCSLWVEVVICAACVAAFLAAVIWPRKEGELADEIEDALLGMRYAAQCVRLLMLWRLHRQQRLRSHHLRVFTDFTRENTSACGQGAGPDPEELLRVAARTLHQHSPDGTTDFYRDVSTGMLDLPVDASEMPSSASPMSQADHHI